MAVVHVLGDPLDDARRGELVFDGQLLVFKDPPALTAFRDRLDGLIREAFGTHDPVLAQWEHTREDYLDRVHRLQRRVRVDSEVRRQFVDALTGTGANADRTYLDWVHLRVLPHGQSHRGERTEGTGFHRDTWSSNVYAQTNWWTPVYPLTSERTLAFYPGYWARPLANTSREWDLEKLRALRRGDRPPADDEAMPLIPEPAGPVDDADELRLVLGPGDLLCFSGAHVHASVPNESGAARFSVEVRTVCLDDLRHGRGAPNVDGEAPRTPYDWFEHAITGRSLADDRLDCEV
jgi:hypothetical protein